MDDQSREILDNLPQRMSRSRLAPYRELIHELRRRRRTYREIARVLAEKCQCRVSISTLHDFVRIRTRSKREQPQPLSIATGESMKSGSAETLRGKKATKLESEPGLPAENVQHKITALKQRPEPTDKKSNPFQYDPNEPLRLPVVKGRGTDST